MKNVSIAAKLAILFAMTARVVARRRRSRSVGGDLLSAPSARHAPGLPSARPIESINGLVYAVVMDSRGIYISADPKIRQSSPTAWPEYLDRMTRGVADWRTSPPRSVPPTPSRAASPNSASSAWGPPVAAARSVEAARRHNDNDANRSVAPPSTRISRPSPKASPIRPPPPPVRLGTLTRQSRLMVALSIGLAVVVSLFSFWRVRSDVTKPIRRLVAVMAQISAGRTDVEVPLRDRGGEIGAIAAAGRRISRDRRTVRHHEGGPLRRGPRPLSERQTKIDTAITAFDHEIRDLTTELGRAVRDPVRRRPSSDRVDPGRRRLRSATSPAPPNRPPVTFRPRRRCCRGTSASVAEINACVVDATGNCPHCCRHRRALHRCAVQGLAGSAQKIGEVVGLDPLDRRTDQPPRPSTLPSRPPAPARERPWLRRRRQRGQGARRPDRQGDRGDLRQIIGCSRPPTRLGGGDRGDPRHHPAPSTASPCRSPPPSRSKAPPQQDRPQRQSRRLRHPRGRSQHPAKSSVAMGETARSAESLLDLAVGLDRHSSDLRSRVDAFLRTIAAA